MTDDPESVIRAGKFNARWYADRYPDVRILGMDPAEHYRQLGWHMGRLPGPDFTQDPMTALARKHPAPPKNRELLAAHEIARNGSHRLGIAFAKLHVPQDMHYTIETLRANAALAGGDEAGWLACLNRYIGHFGAAPVEMRPKGAELPDRFTTAPLPDVTGGPLISVIMPAWHAERTIRAAARSILNQTWRNLELLIVDDASADGTWGVLQEIAASDPRVRIWRNPVNVGPYVSKNIVVAMARGEWITGHDADDWAHPQRLEQHMQEISACPTPPRASVTFMVRLEADGRMDRFAGISGFSIDGITRDASISCQYRADFLRNTLGGWDTMRFGADSELITRATKVIGDEFRRFPRIGMLCMNYEGSLTNNSTHGVDRLTGPALIRRTYAEAYGKWHKTLGPEKPALAKLPFPPVAGNRPFEAPAEALVPLHHIRRNYAVHTGLDPVLDEAVTVICATKRPWFAPRVTQMLRAQTHRNLHVVYVAHGRGHDLAMLRAELKDMAKLTIIEVPDPGTSLGRLLNLGLDACTTDLVAKLDDDDFYGPDYIRRALAALRYNGEDGVAIVGKERAYCYVEDANVTALRFPARSENALRSRVFGSTIFWSRKALGDQRFIDANTGEDSRFFADAHARGAKIYSAEAADYLCVRYASTGAHTWTVSSEEFLSPAQVLAHGLRLDLAYASPTPPGPSPVPGKPPAAT